MLPFFTDPYPDELVYSAIARYHFYSGNTALNDTLEDVFQSRTAVVSVGIGGRLSILAQQMGPNYSVESLLTKHTIYPYYDPFLSMQRQQKFLKDAQGKSSSQYGRLGMLERGICKKNGLYYCPECALKDIEQFGEPYIHREHQLQGIDYCAHHEVKLKRYQINLSTRSAIEYVRFDRKLLDLSILKVVELNEFMEIQVKLAKMAYQLLQIPINQFSREDIILKYRTLFRERNLITIANRVGYNNLFESILAKFPKGFLEKYDSYINVNDNVNWLKLITSNSWQHVHPFRHLLVLYFLDQDVETFMQVEPDAGPFGKGPWPCLNKVAPHFKKTVITDVTVKRGFSHLREPVGVFSCACGFVYTRKGPDVKGKNKYRIGLIKTCGDMWMKKLRELKKMGLSLGAIAEELDVGVHTVKKHLTTRKYLKETEIVTDENLIKQYRSVLLEGMKQFPNYSRTQLVDLYGNKYRYLSKNDKEWFNENLPAKRKKDPKKLVDWDKRDQEYYTKIKLLYSELLMLDKPVRITRWTLGKRLNIFHNINKRIHNLPHTNKLLNEITESVQDFQTRRCCKKIDQMLLDNEPISLWKIYQISGGRLNYFYEIKPRLEEYIKIKQKIK